MNTADKLMNIAIDGDPGEDVVVRDEDRGDEDVVEETTITKKVRKEPPQDKVIIIED